MGKQDTLEIQTRASRDRLGLCYPLTHERRRESQVCTDAAQEAREDHKDAEGLETQTTVDNQAKETGNKDQITINVLK